MSATNSVLRRSASGCTTTSIGLVLQCGAQPLGNRFVVRAGRRKGNVGRDAGIENARILRGREHANGERDRVVIDGGPRGI